MGLKSSIESATKTGGAENSDKEVSVSSSTLAMLQKGIQAVEERSVRISEKWAEKQKNAKKVILCLGKGCGGKFKSLGGIKAHWRSKKNECSEKSGYQEVADVEITAADRLLPGDEEKADLILRCQDAARKARDEVYGKRPAMTSPGTIDAKYLIKCSVGTMLDRGLKAASTEEIKKFAGMRFDSSNSTKKTYAMLELKKRGESLV
jgi:hypothetical protein